MPSVVNPRSGPFPIYSSTSPPTVDVGIFTVAKTGVDLKAAATTTIFTVPAGRTFVLIQAMAQVTAVTSGGAGTLTSQIKESSAARQMNTQTLSTSSTPVANQTVWLVGQLSTGIYSNCTAGNSVQVVLTASNAGSTTVTGTVLATGYYIA